MKKIFLSLLLLILIAVGATFAINGKDNYDPSRYHVTATNGINKGSKLTLTLPDQFDKSHAITDDTQQIIFVFAKDTGHIVKEFLKKQPKEYLEERHTLFVADISPMPTIIRNTFALPDLRKSSYSVLLIYDEAIAKILKNEAKADKIAVAKLDHGTITKIDFISSEEELNRSLAI
jgi:uncharacterized protein YxeA